MPPSRPDFDKLCRLDFNSNRKGQGLPSIVDPMTALVSLDGALREKSVKMQRCELHPELRVMVDYPNGSLRLTYAKLHKSRVQAIVIFIPAEPVDGVPCFGIGYAVAENVRGRGIATQVVPQTIEELRHGFKRNGRLPFYVEAIVAKTNGPSNRLAARLLSTSPAEGADSFSGEPILQYLKLIS
jgi:hypothetical protein